jgi:hypothetical protein
MSDVIRLRRGTTAEWEFKNPILRQGEPGVDLTTGDLKIGNGIDRWLDLEVVGGLGGLRVEVVTEEEYNSMTPPRPSNVLYIKTP